jgi:hypothetical protein
MTRPRLQLHLSTLLIVTVLAAGLVWLNVKLQRDVCFQGYGWPMWCFNGYDDWNWSAVALNIGVCLALLAVAAAVIEWVTRRMKRGAA